jgi:putative sterol carrier protein
MNAETVTAGSGLEASVVMPFPQPYTTTVEQFFQAIPPMLSRKNIEINALVRFDISGRGTWHVDFVKHEVVQDAERKPTVIVRAHERDFMALVEGRMSPADGIISERLHIAGDAATIGALIGALERLRLA